MLRAIFRAASGRTRRQRGAFVSREVRVAADRFRDDGCFGRSAAPPHVNEHRPNVCWVSGAFGDALLAPEGVRDHVCDQLQFVITEFGRLGDTR